jgi:hypothetical protein
MIRFVIGIFNALRIVHSQKLAGEWVHLLNKNEMFNGSTPLPDTCPQPLRTNT